MVVVRVKLCNLLFSVNESAGNQFWLSVQKITENDAVCYQASLEADTDFHSLRCLSCGEILLFLCLETQCKILISSLK